MDLVLVGVRKWRLEPSLQVQAWQKKGIWTANRITKVPRLSASRCLKILKSITKTLNMCSKSLATFILTHLDTKLKYQDSHPILSVSGQLFNL